jgi:hypothetical protein
VIDAEQDSPDEMRTPGEVAARCVVLLGVVAAGYEQPRTDIVEWLREQSLWGAVSPNEAAFLQSDTPIQKQFVNATWRAEALHALLWALDQMPVLCPPTECCDLNAVREAMPDLYADTSEFISSARLRDESTIKDVLGAIYHTHWQVRDAQLNQRPIPNGFDPGAVFERHYAYNWLTGYCNQEWDETSTDT